MALPGQDSVERLVENEQRFDAFLNLIGTYQTRLGAQVETIPSLMERLQNLYNTDAISYTLNKTGGKTRILTDVLSDIITSSGFSQIDPLNVSDSTAGFQSLVNSLPSGGKLRITPGTYKITGTISSQTSNITIECDPGVVFNCVGMPDGTPVFRFYGTKTTLGNVTSTITKGASTITGTAGTVGTLGLDDLVKIDTAELFNQTRAEYYKGEIQKVSSVNNGTGVVTLIGNTYDSYSISGHTPVLSKITPIKNIIWIGGTFLFDTSKFQNCLAFDYFDNVTVDGCEIDGAMNAAIAFREGVNFEVIKSKLSNCRNNTVSTGYAVTSNGSQYGNVSKNKFYRNRHDYTDSVSGVTRFVTVNNNVSFNSIGYAISPHGCSEYISVKNNIVVGALGLQSRGHNTTFAGNEIINARARGIDVSEEGHFGLTLDDNTVTLISGATAGIGIDTGSGLGLPNVGYDTKITNNKLLLYGVGAAITSGPIDRLKVSNNDIYHPNGHGIALTDCSSAQITDNYIKKASSSSHYAIVLFGTGSSYQIEGNYAVEGWGACIRVGVATTTKVRIGVNYADSTIDLLSCPSNAVASATIINNGGFKNYAATPALPTGTGASNYVTNKFGVPYAIHHTGGVGIRIVTAGAPARAITGDQSPFFLNSGDSVYFATTVPSAWTWYGIGS